MSSVLVLAAPARAAAPPDSDATPPEILESVDVIAKRSASDISNTTRLDHEDLTRPGLWEVQEVLRGTPGLTLSTGVKGGYSSVNLRGAGGLGIVQIDGVPMLQTIREAFNIGGLPAEAFETAEIVRGSGAMLHGSRALGGVIRLESRDAGHTGVSARVEGGSFATLRETVAGSYAGDKARFTAAASRDDVFDGTPWADARKGNPERDPFHGTLATAHGSAQLGSGLDWDGSLLYSQTHLKIDKEALLPTGRIGITDDLNAWFKQETWLAQNTANAELSEHWTSRLKLGYTQQNASALTGGLPIAYRTRLYLARWQNEHPLLVPDGKSPGLSFVWGGEGRYEEGERPNGGFQGRRRLASGFSRIEANWGDWSGVAAVQVDSYDDWGTHPLMHAGLVWQTTRDLALHASGGIGYRPPSFNELLVPFIGNPNLVPEHGAGGEIGLDWQASQTTEFKLTGFYNHYDNLIVAGRLANGLAWGQNVPHARVAGIEAQWSTRWNERVTTGIDFTYSPSKNLDTGDPLPRRPEEFGRFWAEWRPFALPLNLWGEAVYRGETYDAGRIDYINDSLRINLSATYTVNPQLSLYIRGENLTDNRTPQITGWNMPGAAVYGGIKVDFR